MELRDTFPVPTFEDWRAQARAELKGQDPPERPSAEGIPVKPLYERSRAPAVPARGGGRAWLVRQEIRLADPDQARAEAEEALRGGAGAVDFRLDSGTRCGGAARRGGPESGVLLRTAADLRTLVAGLDCPVFLHAGASAMAVAAGLRAAGLGGLRGGLGLDPLGLVAAGHPVAVEALYDQAARLVAEEPGLRVMTVAARPYHEAGASVAEELALSLATGLEYLRALDARGVDLAAAQAAMEFTFALSPRIFPEVARLRAARLLWSRVVTLLGGAPSMFLHGRTDRYSQSALDPSTNLLRTTLEAFAGAVGGCDSLTVNPMDVVRGATTPATRRHARNQLLLLQEEAGLHRVDDPGAGSGSLESLTEEVARKAWDLFQEVEAAGGMRKALEQGLPQRRVLQTSQARADRLARGRQSMVGVTQYVVPPVPLPELPALEELPAEDLAVGSYEAAVEALRGGATLQAVGRALLRGLPRAEAPPLPISRAAVPFERVQQRARGAGLKALLAVMGSPKMGRIRADFCGSMLRAGGFATEVAELADPEAVALEARQGFQVVVACAEDGEYAGLVPGLARALEGTALLAVAGLPPDAEDLRRAGVQEFLHKDSDRPRTLEGLMDRLEVGQIEGERA